MGNQNNFIDLKKNGYQKEWFKDEQFWVDFGPLMFNSGSWEDAYVQINQVVKLLQLEQGSKVLDSCCGVGRHSIELAQKGMEVTGVDLSPAYIEAAKESAATMDLAIDFQLADVREFISPNHFDAALNLYTSYGYFETQEDEELYLKNLFQSLKPGGQLLIDTISKEALARDFIEDEWFEEEGNLICLSYEIIEDFSRLVNRWMIIAPDGSRKDRRFLHKIYSGMEMKAILQKAGFVRIRLFGDLEGAPYDSHVKRLIAVAQKPFA